jgi:hypothetical protein
LLQDDTSVTVPSHYVKFLKERLQLIQADVALQTTRSKEQQKQQFDRANRVVTPTFHEGQKVWLENLRPRPKSNSVLTHRRFGKDLFMIVKVVTRPSTFTPSADKAYPSLDQTQLPAAYQIVNTRSGKLVRGLVPSRRLKAYVSRNDFDQLHPPDKPPNLGDSPTTNQSTDAIDKCMDSVAPGVTNTPEITTSSQTETAWHSALNIVRKRVYQNQLQFLVRFNDMTCSWCNEHDVSQPLKTKYFATIAARRRRRQREARAAFKDE